MPSTPTNDLPGAIAGAPQIHVPGQEHLVLLTNRSTKVLYCTWGGIRYDIRPGLNLVHPDVARQAYFQNPLMGSECPGSPDEFTSLVGIAAYGHDTSALEQSDCRERLDRTQLAPEEQQVVAITQPHRGILRTELTGGPMPSTYLGGPGAA